MWYKWINLPRGTTAQRPNTTSNTKSYLGLIRYNSEISSFEGFGAGDSWGTLGGVIDVDQKRMLQKIVQVQQIDKLNFIQTMIIHQVKIQLEKD